MPKLPLDGENVMKTISLRISQKDLDRIKVVARKEKRAYTDLIRVVVMRYVEEYNHEAV